MTDTERLLYIMRDIDGFADLELDRYDHAFLAAVAAGREEPNEADELQGIRMLIDAAMQREEVEQEGNRYVGQYGNRSRESNKA